VFRRRPPTEPESSAETLAKLEAEAAAGRKAKPTPTRKEAEQLRKERLAPPKDRRAAARQARQRTRADRERRRQGMLAGDPKALPARDAGPVRGFARDYVDARRSPAEYFIVLAFGLVLLGFVPNVTVRTASALLLYAMLSLIVVDSVIVVRGLSREAAKRFPGESRKGLAPYAVMRTMQIRRWRIPKPRVKPGDPI
jgi:Protein of unknown function (DUF3043)